MDGILDVHNCEIILNAGRFCDQHLQALVLATPTTTGLHEKVRRKTPAHLSHKCVKFVEKARQAT